MMPKLCQKNDNQKQLNIAIDESVANGIYSNLAIINHSNSEFIVDFITHVIMREINHYCISGNSRINT